MKEIYYVIVDFGIAWIKKHSMKEALKQQKFYTDAGINAIIIPEEDLEEIRIC